MKKANTTVTPLAEELQKNPDLQIDWILQPGAIQQRDGVTYAWTANHPKRGRISMVLVRDFSGDSISMWDQPVLFEPEGSIHLPYYEKQTKRGSEHYVGLVMTARPITADPSGNDLGIISVEAPRGLGEDIETKVTFREIHRTESGLDLSEMDEETQLVPTRTPIFAGLSNPNTSYWAHNQDQYLIEVDKFSQKRFPDGGIQRPREKIYDLVFYRWPDEVDTLARRGRDGDAFFVCAMTQSILYRFGAYMRKLRGES